MGFWGKILEELFDLMAIEAHIRKCEECKKKYKEVLEHAKEEFKKKEAEK